jgi:hypothetical protein
MIKITKANGDIVPFEGHKIVDAMMRSGASRSEAEKVLSLVLKQIDDGISTAKIYRIAQNYLRQVSGYAAGRYRLKKAVFDLGPGGYPFEKFVARLLDFKGYKTSLNIIEKGRCVNHELDIVAENDYEKIMIECKFHRDKGNKNDIKIPLYIQSRFIDMKFRWESEGEKRNIQGMIVTNTRFSTDAEDYGKCVGLKLVSWDYPHGNSLRDWIDESGYHPITSLDSLSTGQKSYLMEKGIVLCLDLIDKESLLKNIGMNESKARKVLEEARLISGEN